ncbi:MAG: PilN domain-containing protein [Deltaproteobacteria bacterium]|nr:PilN domain-containing protein [Deltaproteobacteria bacterium]
MPVRITGIDMGEAHITAVQIKAGLNRYELSFCTKILLENGDIGEGLDRLNNSMDLKTERCFVSIPPSQVAFRNLEMPFEDAKKIRQTLPYELETLLPYPVEELITDFITTRPNSAKEILSASIKTEAVSRYLKALDAHALDPELISVSGLSIIPWLLKQGAPDHFLLMNLEEKTMTLFFCGARRVALIRSLTLNASPLTGIDPVNMAVDQNPQKDLTAGETWIDAVYSEVHHTLHACNSHKNRVLDPERIYLTGAHAVHSETGPLIREAFGLPVAWVDISEDKRIKQGNLQACEWVPGEMNAALALTMLDPKRDQHLNFRRGTFSKRRGKTGVKKGVKKGIIFLLLLLVLLGANRVTDYYFLKKTYEQLDAELMHLFKETLPQVTRIVDPVQQLRVAVKQLEKTRVNASQGKSGKVTLNLLKDISARIPEHLNVKISRMIIDPETVRLSGKTDTFNAVDSLKSELTPSAFFSEVIISSANMDKKDNRVKFELKLKRNL